MNIIYDPPEAEHPEYEEHQIIWNLMFEKYKWQYMWHLRHLEDEIDEAEVKLFLEVNDHKKGQVRVICSDAVLTEKIFATLQSVK